jgi:hypothetical protein
VELLLSVDAWFRDKFFNVRFCQFQLFVFHFDRFFSSKIYASYLAQAVYRTFFDICPDSRMNLTDKFKEFIVSTITEWISGE